MFLCYNNDRLGGLVIFMTRQQVDSATPKVYAKVVALDNAAEVKLYQAGYLYGYEHSKQPLDSKSVQDAVIGIKSQMGTAPENGLALFMQGANDSQQRVLVCDRNYTGRGRDVAGPVKVFELYEKEIQDCTQAFEEFNLRYIIAADSERLAPALTPFIIKFDYTNKLNNYVNSTSYLYDPHKIADIKQHTFGQAHVASVLKTDPIRAMADIDTAILAEKNMKESFQPTLNFSYINNQRQAASVSLGLKGSDTGAPGFMLAITKNHLSPKGSKTVCFVSQGLEDTARSIYPTAEIHTYDGKFAAIDQELQSTNVSTRMEELFINGEIAENKVNDLAARLSPNRNIDDREDKAIYWEKLEKQLQQSSPVRVDTEDAVGLDFFEDKQYLQRLQTLQSDVRKSVSRRDDFNNCERAFTRVDLHLLKRLVLKSQPSDAPFLKTIDREIHKLETNTDGDIPGLIQKFANITAPTRQEDHDMQQAVIERLNDTVALRISIAEKSKKLSTALDRLQELAEKDPAMLANIEKLQKKGANFFIDANGYDKIYPIVENLVNLPATLGDRMVSSSTYPELVAITAEHTAHLGQKADIDAANAPLIEKENQKLQANALKRGALQEILVSIQDDLVPVGRELRDFQGLTEALSSKNPLRVTMEQSQRTQRIGKLERDMKTEQGIRENRNLLYVGNGVGVFGILAIAAGVVTLVVAPPVALPVLAAAAVVMVTAYGIRKLQFNSDELAESKMAEIQAKITQETKVLANMELVNKNPAIYKQKQDQERVLQKQEQTIRTQINDLDRADAIIQQDIQKLHSAFETEGRRLDAQFVKAGDGVRQSLQAQLTDALRVDEPAVVVQQAKHATNTLWQGAVPQPETAEPSPAPQSPPVVPAAAVTPVAAEAAQAAVGQSPPVESDHEVDETAGVVGGITPGT